MARLKKSQWLKAQRFWMSDPKISYQKVADAFGVSKSAVLRYAKRNDWSRDSNVTANATGGVNGDIGVNSKSPEEHEIKGIEGDDNILESVNIGEKKTKLKRGGIRAGQGRPKGSLGELNMTIQDRAAVHGNDAINTMAEIMNDEEVPPHIRVQASDKLLDRGFGKPHIYVDVGTKDEGETSHANLQSFLDVMAQSRARQEELALERKDIIEGTFTEVAQK